MAQKTIIVVGAGIVGVSTALWLQRDGFAVTIVDREGPAAGTSYGNAGILAAASIVPVTVPGLLRKAPGLLFSRNEPLFLRWRYLPKLLPFLIPFLRHANKAAVDRIAPALHSLLHDSPDQHRALAAGTPAEAYLSDEDWIYGYADQAAYEADSFGWDIRRAHGMRFDVLDHAALKAHDPDLGRRFGFAVRQLGHGRISDPGAYVTALMDVFLAGGGQFQKATVTDVAINNGRCTGLTTARGVLTADQFVLTLGAWSGPLAAKLGVTVPLESERGYHVEYVNPNITLRQSLMVASGKFGMNSMDGRLRAAGVVEFAGIAAPASEAPIALLKRQVATLFPDLTYDRIDEWMGHRPSTADSLPVIGKSPKASNLLLGYGHQHVGLTGGPKTGRWLAALAAGRTPNTDLGAYAPDRTTWQKPGVN